MHPAGLATGGTFHSALKPIRTAGMVPLEVTMRCVSPTN